MQRKCLLLIAFVFFPFDFARAIPPPDLIFSATQILFTTAGLLLSSIIIWWTHLHTWIKSLKNKRMFFVVCGVLLGTGLLITSQVVPLIWNIHWQKVVTAEMAALWVEYEPMYSAESEVSVFWNDPTIAPGVTWDKFMKEVGEDDYIVVDIRDQYGFEAGHIPGSINMRFGDLVRGDWMKLLRHRDKHIYIVCYIGSTGNMTMNFLRDKGFTKLYRPKGGIILAVKEEPDFKFEGILIAPGVRGQTHVIPEEQLPTILSIENIQVVDTRAPSHYVNEISIPVQHRHFREFMTTSEIDDFVSSLDPLSTYLPLCDSELSCYQGELLLEDLKRANITSPGVYRIKAP